MQKYNNPKIIINENPFSKDGDILHIVQPGSTFIDFLSEIYPRGFPRKTSAKLNGETLDIENYDIALNSNDVVAIEILPASVGDVLGVATFGLVYIPAKQALTPDIPTLPPIELPSSVKRRDEGVAYDLRMQTNIARLNEPIPSVYGKIKWYPDLGASPWFEYSGNEKYLNQLFCLGWGQFDIDTVRIGDIDVTQLDNVQYSVHNPNEEVDLFHDNMYTNPLFKGTERKNSLLHQRRTASFEYYVDFDKGNSCLLGPSGNSNFIEFVAPGDEVLIGCAYTPGFEGVYIVLEVTEFKITFNDVSDWPGDNNNPGPVHLYNNTYVGYAYPGTTDVDYPEKISSYRNVTLGTSDVYITSPAGTTSDTFYLDVNFYRGFYYYNL